MWNQGQETESWKQLNWNKVSSFKYIDIFLNSFTYEMQPLINETVENDLLFLIALKPTQISIWH